MPWLLTTAQRVQVHNELQGATRERMLREGAEVLDARPPAGARDLSAG